MNNQKKLATYGTQSRRRRKTKQKHNIICVGHHHAQANTNNVNKTWAEPFYKQLDYDWFFIISACGKTYYIADHTSLRIMELFYRQWRSAFEQVYHKLAESGLILRKRWKKLSFFAAQYVYSFTRYTTLVLTRVIWSLSLIVMTGVILCPVFLDCPFVIAPSVFSNIY